MSWFNRFTVHVICGMKPRIWIPHEHPLRRGDWSIFLIHRGWFYGVKMWNLTFVSYWYCLCSFNREVPGEQDHTLPALPCRSVCQGRGGSASHPKRRVGLAPDEAEERFPEATTSGLARQRTLGWQRRVRARVWALSEQVCSRWLVSTIEHRCEDWRQKKVADSRGDIGAIRYDGLPLSEKNRDHHLQTVQRGDAFEDTALKPGWEIVKS
jgi:hypothetical protein